MLDKSDGLFEALKPDDAHLEQPPGTEAATQAISDKLAMAGWLLQQFQSPWEHPQTAEGAVGFIQDVAALLLPCVGWLAAAVEQQCREQQLQPTLCTAWRFATVTLALCRHLLSNYDPEHRSRWLPPLLEQLSQARTPAGMPGGHREEAQGICR
jgi:hypothetical protein